MPTPSTPRHFLRLADASAAEYRRLFDRARDLKARRRAGEQDASLRGKTLVLILEKASTRTLLSFEAAMFQLGGHAINLPMAGSQLSRGEPLGDTARVVSGYADAVVFRTSGDARMREFVAAASIPVINGLTHLAHPVQVATDLFTVEEHLGAVAGKALAFVGDGATNMALSFLEAAPLFGYHLRLAAPRGYQPPPALLAEAGRHVTLTEDPRVAVEGADVVVTDVWTSMGQEAEAAARKAAFAGYCVDEALLARARPGAIVLHCLPAHRGEGISAGVLEGAQSVVWAEAENRMHVQKALLELVLGVLP